MVQHGGVSATSGMVGGGEAEAKAADLSGGNSRGAGRRAVGRRGAAGFEGRRQAWRATARAGWWGDVAAREWLRRQGGRVRSDPDVSGSAGKKRLGFWTRKFGGVHIFIGRGG